MNLDKLTLIFCIFFVFRLDLKTAITAETEVSSTNSGAKTKQGNSNNVKQLESMEEIYRNTTGDKDDAFQTYNHVTNTSTDETFPNSPVFGIWDNEMTYLRKQLLEGYDKNNRPVDRVYRNTTEIYLYFFMRYVNEFDEVAGHLKCTVGISAYWQDTRLVWNPGEYNGFNQSLTFNLKELWVPHVSLWNPVDTFVILDPENDQLLVAVEHNSWIHYLIGGVITTHCVPNVRFFPFDKHECEINLMMYESAYYFQGIKLKNLENNYLKFEFVQHPRWNIYTRQSTVADIMGFSVGKFPYILRRRPIFMLFNLIIPILLLSFLNVCVFAIPIQSGERTSFSITVFLALAVFMTVVADHVPHSSDPMPLWSFFLLFKLLFSALIALVSTTVIRMYNKDIRQPIPSLFISITSVWDKLHDSCICKRKNKSNKDQYDFDIKTATENNDSSSTEHDWSVNSELSDNAEPLSWHHVAYVIDKLCLFVFLLVALTETTVTFVITVYQLNV